MNYHHLPLRIRSTALTIVTIVLLASCTSRQGTVEPASTNSAEPPSSTPPITETMPTQIELGNTWAIGLGGDYTDNASDALATDDGGTLIVGDTRSGGAGDTDALAIKVGMNGEIQWAHAYGGVGSDNFNVVKQLKDGNFIAGGYTESSGNEQGDAWLVKIDPSGNILWQLAIGGKAEDYIADIDISPAGDVFVVGTTQSHGNEWQDIWAAKIGADGNVAWQKVYYTTGSDYGISIMLLNDGSLILAGRAWNNGNSDVLLMEIAPETGETQWGKIYASAGNQMVTGVINTVDNGFILSGYSFVPGAGYDGLVVKITRNGELEWAKSFGTPNGTDYIYSLAPTLQGYVLVGESNSFGNGGTDGWLFEINQEGNIAKQIYFGDKDHDNLSSIVLSSPKLVLVGNTFSFRSFAKDIILLTIDQNMEIDGCIYCGTSTAIASPLNDFTTTDNPNFLKMENLDFAVRSTTQTMTDISQNFRKRILFP